MSLTLLRHPRIWTGSASVPWTDALLVDAGRIVAVGADAVEAGGRPVDLPGEVVMPGLHDAHIHTEWLSRDMASVSSPSIEVR